MIRLTSPEMEVAIDPLGAELQSLVTKADNHEWLWQGDPEFFGRRAPNLFPVIGLLKDGAFTHKGHTYEMPLHGFALTSTFEVLERQASAATFRLCDDEESRTIYPFPFCLDISYVLEDASVKVGYKVSNPSDETLLFSIGAHPAFNLPFFEGEEYEDYYIEFEEAETLDRRLAENRLFTGERKRILENDRILPLSHDLFYHLKAIALDDFKSKTLWIKSKKHDCAIRVDFPGFPYLALWSTPQAHAPFLCIEPWHGIAANHDDGTALTEKEGIIALPGGEVFETYHVISLK